MGAPTPSPATPGRCLEDFEVGAVYRHPLGRTITEADNVWFTALTMNTNQLHFNNHYAAAGLFNRASIPHSPLRW